MKNYGKALLLLCLFAISFVPSGSKATLSVISGNEGISISGTPTITGYEECRMNTHVHTSACGSTPPTGGHTETETWPSKKVTVTVSGVVSGYGWAGGAFTDATIDGSPIGAQSEVLGEVGIFGFIGPIRKAYTEDKTISFSVSGDSLTTPLGPHHWTATGGINLRSVVWIASGTAALEVGTVISLQGKRPKVSEISINVSTGNTMSYQPSPDKAWSGKTSKGTWQVEYKYICRHCLYRSGNAALSDSHSHHFVCNGCGKHVACQYNPGIHQVDATCPLSGCNATNVYRCVPHTCPTGTPPTGSTPPPSGSTPPPSKSDIQYACGDHSGPSSGSSGHAAASCGTSGHYICDGADHSLQASCPSMDTNGNSCTVANFYACDGHTHVYPEPPPPPSPPTATCAAGHSYNPNSNSAVNRHRTRRCRFSECRQEWQRCVSDAPICNKPYRKKNGLRCWAE